MGRAIDIQRRRRPKPEVPLLPSHRRRSSPGFFLLLLVAAGVLLFWNKLNVAPSQSQPKPVSPSFSSTLPTTPSPLPAEETASSTVTSQTPSYESPVPTSSPSPPPAEEASSASPTITKATLSIRIFNGSGTAGQANTLKKHLESQGFTIRSIAVAKTRRADTIVYYQKDQRAKADFVAGFIPDRLIVFEENDTLAKPDDILIIVGAK